MNSLSLGRGNGIPSRRKKKCTKPLNVNMMGPRKKEPCLTIVSAF